MRKHRSSTLSCLDHLAPSSGLQQTEFSRFDAGPDGAPWERQDQIVLGAAWFVRPSAKLFAEYVRIDGYAPLNFISGGNIRNEKGEVIPDRTHSDRSAHSNVFLIGANLAF